MNDEFKNFDRVTRVVLSVSKSELHRREIEYEKQAALNPKRRGPKRGSKRKLTTASSPGPASS